MVEFTIQKRIDVEVESSNLKKLTYFPEDEYLDITFLKSNRVYRYFDVPAEIFLEVAFDSESAGKQFIKLVRGTYTAEELTEDYNE